MILFHRRAYHELGKTESQQLTMTYILQGWREKQKDKEGREQAGRSKGKSRVNGIKEEKERIFWAPKLRDASDFLVLKTRR